MSTIRKTLCGIIALPAIFLGLQKWHDGAACCEFLLTQLPSVANVINQDKQSGTTNRRMIFPCPTVYIPYVITAADAKNMANPDGPRVAISRR